ncbi:MAG: HNH endonuclease [Planctomycetota bacterium]|jgi:putative restriction endonuclease
MAKAVLIVRPGSVYDDLPEIRYHFPRTYVRAAERSLGDWILYYEPRRDKGRQAYFATARLSAIDADPEREGHYYARISDYVEFVNVVPFRVRDGGGFRYFESALQKPDGSVNQGVFQRAVHQIPDDEYLAIVALGMSSGLPSSTPSVDGSQPVEEPEVDYNRPTLESLVARPVRDAAFRAIILDAYQSTCAMTGLRLVNGGGRPEVEAAHIRPVNRHGPDSPRNGMALSRTCHWMFERGLLSVEDDGKILVAKRLVPDRVVRMLNRDGYVSKPAFASSAPHPQFVRYHRELVFVG